METVATGKRRASHSRCRGSLQAALQGGRQFGANAGCTAQPSRADSSCYPDHQTRRRCTKTSNQEIQQVHLIKYAALVISQMILTILQDTLTLYLSGKNTTRTKSLKHKCHKTSLTRDSTGTSAIIAANEVILRKCNQIGINSGSVFQRRITKIICESIYLVRS